MLVVAFLGSACARHQARLGPLSVKADVPVVADVADLVGGPHVEVVGSKKKANITFHVGDLARKLPIKQSKDPHVWLSPPLMEGIVQQVADRLSKADRANAIDYQRNANAYIVELVGLDARIGDELVACRTRVLNTKHNSFSWLAARYGLTQRVVKKGGIDLDAIDKPGHSYLSAMDANVELLREALGCG
jgi:ABC-type Zn uptake system ZnuABC Zn-binding protein ZnuA